MHCSTLKLESGHGLHTSFVTHESVSAVCPKAVFRAKIVKLLALALSNLVHDLANLVTKWPTLALANLVTNLTKPSLDLDKISARLDTIIKQTTPPHHQ